MKSVFYPEVGAGGFTRVDGTIQFYFRVNALLDDGMKVLDIGAGRGANSETSVAAARKLYEMKGCATEVIGLDIDPVVLQNPFLDKAIVYDGQRIPLEDESVDVIVSDYTFEHVADPDVFAREIVRVLKSGGWVCARTPYLFSLLVVVSALIPNRCHSRVLAAVQPWRKVEDVFPTVYKLNSFSALKRYFPEERFEHYSYTFTPEPAYHFNNRFVYALMLVYQNLKKLVLGGEVLLVFIRKR